jgi:hypothetical protein
MTARPKSKSRRQAIMDTPSVPEELDPTPIEIPADAKAAGKSVEQQIQEQIAIHMAKKSSGD